MGQGEKGRGGARGGDGRGEKGGEGEGEIEGEGGRGRRGRSMGQPTLEGSTSLHLF